MSDEYLWDRSGEPDPEVERLEHVMRTLAFAPRGAMVLGSRVEAAVRPPAPVAGWRFVIGIALLSAAVTLLLIGGWQLLVGQERRIEVRTIEVPAVTGPLQPEAKAPDPVPTVDEILWGKPVPEPRPAPTTKTKDDSTPTVDEILLGKPPSRTEPKRKPKAKTKVPDRVPTVDEILDPHSTARG
jgi:hypothetical protein